jgi:hypothetical protein
LPPWPTISIQGICSKTRKGFTPKRHLLLLPTIACCPAIKSEFVSSAATLSMYDINVSPMTQLHRRLI